MINFNQNFRKLKYEFLKNGIVTIHNFFNQEAAEDLLNHFRNMPRDWWVHSTFPGEMEGMNHTPIDNTPQVISAIKTANEAYQKGEFSYSFKTGATHNPDCPCGECNLRRYLNTQEVLDYMEKITQIKLSESFELFVSKYTYGDFLSTHHDAGNGKLGFVFSLTKEWKPDWGGLLHFLSEENKSKVSKTLCPSFNTLFLFDLDTSKGSDHFVSHVTKKGVQRISFTGWFR